MSEKLCPDCGHPVAEHKEDGGCLHWQYYKEGSSERVVCSCKRTPADLQPIKAGDTLYTSLGKGVVVEPESGSNAIHLQQHSVKVVEKHCYNCDSPEGKILSICHKCFDVLTVKSEQPTPTMPLDDLICDILSNYAEELSEELREKIGMQISTAIKIEQQAHDSAIAAQAVKEFANEIQRLKSVIKDALLDIDQNCINHAARLLENEIEN